MRLQCAEVLDVLRHKPIVLMDRMGLPQIARTSDGTRKRLLAPLLPQIHQAKKFIFDSGSDEMDTALAVRDTAVAMMQADLFHQPHPIIWIEDPYEDDPEQQRNFYLGIETPGKITVFAFLRTNSTKVLGQVAAQMGLPPLNPKSLPAIGFHPFALEIDLLQPSDQFRVRGSIGQLWPEASQTLQEAIYAYKKLIVTLNTSNHISERIPVPPRKSNDTQRRAYEHHIIRIPVDYTVSSGDGEKQKRRRMHLVRGYVYGKNTRPLEVQRWVKPYWRGDKELGIVSAEQHYEVR